MMELMTNRCCRRETDRMVGSAAAYRSRLIAAGVDEVVGADAAQFRLWGERNGDTVPARAIRPAHADSGRSTRVGGHDQPEPSSSNPRQGDWESRCRVGRDVRDGRLVCGVLVGGLKGHRSDEGSGDVYTYVVNDPGEREPASRCVEAPEGEEAGVTRNGCHRRGACAEKRLQVKKGSPPPSSSTRNPDRARRTAGRPSSA